MQFNIIIEPVLKQLSATLKNVSETAYAQKSSLLNGSSIASHTRHVIEIFQCLIEGYKTGIVNYENRKRNIEIETNKEFASNILLQISTQIAMPNKVLSLQGFYASDNNIEENSMPTNFYRELVYNLEYCIHHMALIRVGINELCSFRLPEDFGVAPSTIKYRMQCAQ